MSEAIIPSAVQTATPRATQNAIPSNEIKSTRWVNVAGLIYVPQASEESETSTPEESKQPTKPEPVLAFKREVESTSPAPDSGSSSYWGKLHLKRLRDAEDVLGRAEEFGIVTRRGGAHCYFQSRYLGNGLYNAARKLTDGAYDLEAEVRVAVLRAERSKGRHKKAR